MKKVLSLVLVLCLVVGCLPMSVGAASVSERENNNTAGTAQSISIGDSISGAISERGDIDFYTFYLPASGKVTLNLLSYLPYYSLYIYNSNGTEMWKSEGNDYNSTVGFRRDEYKIDLSNGTYYVKMEGYKYYNQHDATGRYTIQTSFVSANATEIEPNETAGSANSIVLGNTVRGQIAENTDVDFYRFVLSKSGRVKMEFTSYMPYYSIYVYDSNGTEMWKRESNDYNATVGFRTDSYHVDLSPGQYYIKVIGYKYYNNYDATGNYTIITSFENADATEIEPNDTAEAANSISIGALNRGLIAENTDVDFYSFTHSSSNSLFLNVLSYAEYYSVYIYDTSGKEMWKSEGNNYDSTSGYRTDDFEITLSPGQYFLKFIGYRYYNQFDATGKYSFRLGTSSRPINPSDSIFTPDPTPTPTPTPTSTPTPNTPKNTEAFVTSLMVDGISAMINGSDISVTLPAGSSLKTANVSLTVSEGASVQCHDSFNSTFVNYSNGTYDLRDLFYIKVTSEDESYTRYYTLDTKVYLPLPADISFTDVNPSDWFYADALRAAELGIIRGKPGGRFDGLGRTTRRDFTIMLARLMGANEASLKASTTKSKFSDIEDGNSYLWAIQYVTDRGWMGVSSGNRFDPMSYITRIDTCVAIARALNLTEENSAALFSSASDGSLSAAPRYGIDSSSIFADDIGIPNWAKSDIYSLVGAGIISGYSDGTFKPELTINRAQMAKVMAKAYENLH